MYEHSEKKWTFLLKLVKLTLLVTLWLLRLLRNGKSQDFSYLGDLMYRMSALDMTRHGYDYGIYHLWLLPLFSYSLGAWSDHQRKMETKCSSFFKFIGFFLNLILFRSMGAINFLGFA